MYPLPLPRRRARVFLRLTKEGGVLCSGLLRLAGNAAGNPEAVLPAVVGHLKVDQDLTPVKILGPVVLGPQLRQLGTLPFDLPAELQHLVRRGEHHLQTADVPATQRG